MSQAASMSDENLLELVRGADPLAESAPIEAAETEAALRRLLATASSEDAIATGPATSPHRVRSWGRDARLVYLPLRRSRRLALGGIGVLVVAGVLLGLGLPGGGGTGQGTANAFADWTASPTAPVGEQVPAAEAACEHEQPYPGEPSFAGAMPKVIDTRGPWTLLVYREAAANRLCIVSPSGVAKHESDEGEPTVTVAPGSIKPGLWGSGNGLGGEHQRFSEMDGQVGAGVTAATLVLEDGTKVKTTIANGWFAAWWPGQSRVTSAEVTTATGTVTEQFTSLQHSNQVEREQREQLEQARREIRHAEGTGEGSAQRGQSASTATPTPNAEGQTAIAEEACLARARQTPVAGVPYGAWHALVADPRGSSTIVLLQSSSENANATCLATSSHADITGVASGFPNGKPPTPPAGQIRLEGTSAQGGEANASGGHEGPYSYVYGQVGSGISAVTLVLRGGQRITPDIANGWFAASWPTRTRLASAEVTTNQGTSIQQLDDPTP